MSGWDNGAGGYDDPGWGDPPDGYDRGGYDEVANDAGGYGDDQGWGDQGWGGDGDAGYDRQVGGQDGFGDGGYGDASWGAGGYDDIGDRAAEGMGYDAYDDPIRDGYDAYGAQDPLAYGIGEADALGDRAEPGLERGYDDVADEIDEHRDGLEEAGELALAGLAGGAAGYAFGRHGSKRDRGYDDARFDGYGDRGYGDGGMGYDRNLAGGYDRGLVGGYDGGWDDPGRYGQGTGYDNLGGYEGGRYGGSGWDDGRSRLTGFGGDYGAGGYLDSDRRLADQAYDTEYRGALAGRDMALVNRDAGLLDRDAGLDRGGYGLRGYESQGLDGSGGRCPDSSGAALSLERDMAGLDLADRRDRYDDATRFGAVDGLEPERSRGYADWGGDGDLDESGSYGPRVYGSRGVGGIYDGSGFGGLDSRFDDSYYGGLSGLYGGYDGADLFGGLGGRVQVRNDPFVSDVPLDYGYGRVGNLASYGLTRGSLTASDALRMDDLYLFEQALQSDRTLSESERLRRWSDRLRWESLDDAQRRQRWRLMSHDHRARLGLGNGGWWATQFGASRIDPTYGYYRPLTGRSGLLTSSGLRRGIRHYPLSRDLASRFPMWSRGGVGLGRSLLHWLDDPSRQRFRGRPGQDRLGGGASQMAALEMARRASDQATRDKIRATLANRAAESRGGGGGYRQGGFGTAPGRSAGPITTLGRSGLANLRGGLRRTVSTPSMRPQGTPYVQSTVPSGSYTLSGRRVGPASMPARQAVSAGGTFGRSGFSNMGGRSMGYGGATGRQPFTHHISAIMANPPAMGARFGPPPRQARDGRSLASRVLAGRRGVPPSRARGLDRRYPSPLPASVSGASLRSPLRPDARGWGAPPPQFLRPNPRPIGASGGSLPSSGRYGASVQKPPPSSYLSVPGATTMAARSGPTTPSRSFTSSSRSAPPPYGVSPSPSRPPSRSPRQPEISLAERARAALAAHEAAQPMSRVGLPQPPPFPGAGPDLLDRAKTPAAVLLPGPSRPPSMLAPRPTSELHSRSPIPSSSRALVPTFSRARSPAAASVHTRSPALSPRPSLAGSMRSHSPVNAPKSPAESILKA